MSGSSSFARASHGTPPEPLTLTVHGLPGTAPAEGRSSSRWSGRFTLLLVLLACAAPVVASYFTYYVLRPQGRSNYAELIQPSRGLPADLPLQTLDGRTVTPAALKRQWLLTVVAPGACDAACERMLFEQRQLREMLGRERDRVDNLWLVSDDTPVRSEVLQALTPGTWVLRVPPQALAHWLQPAPGHALSEHMYVVDPMGEWMMRTPPQPEPKRFHKDLERLLRASAFWDRPGREVGP